MIQLRNLLVLSGLFFWAACENKPAATQATAPVGNEAKADSAAIAETIHQFFKWYGETGEQLITRINFVDESGPHPKLDLPKLNQYFAEFMKSGTICTEFIQNETIFYTACAQAWKNENSGELITGFDHDRYYCQQDGDVREFLTAGVKVDQQGGRAAVQLLLDPAGPNGGPRDFEMKKENGKWLLSKVGCL